VHPEPPPLLSPPLLSTAPPPTEPRAPLPRPWGFWLTAAFGLCIACAYVVAQSAVVIVAAIMKGSLTNPATVEALAMNGLVLSICLVVSVPLAVGLSVLFAWLRPGLPVADYLGFKPASWRAIVSGLVCVVGLGLGYDWISTSVGRPEIPEFMVNAYRTAGFVPLLWGAVIVGAPLSEEVFFRGFLFKGFERSPVGGVGAIVITSLGWAVIHLQYDLYDITSIFLLGLLLGFFRLKTGSILPPLLMHMLTNLISTVQVACALG